MIHTKTYNQQTDIEIVYLKVWQIKIKNFTQVTACNIKPKPLEFNLISFFIILRYRLIYISDI